MDWEYMLGNFGKNMTDGEEIEYWDRYNRVMMLWSVDPHMGGWVLRVFKILKV